MAYANVLIDYSTMEDEDGSVPMSDRKRISTEEYTTDIRIVGKGVNQVLDN